MLKVTALNHSYGAVQALREVSLEAPAGAITCVMGRNGVGKTTLLRSLMGQLGANRGVIRLGNHDISRAKAHLRAKLGLALVPQGREIFPKLTVEENLLVGLSARRDGSRRLPDLVFTTFPILKDFRKRMGGDLSGGQQQQLAIARALVGDPQVLMLDEPTEGIQPNVIDLIGDVLQRLAAQGMAIILVEQYFEFIRRIGHRYVVMDRGRVVDQGTVATMDAAAVGKHLSV